MYQKDLLLQGLVKLSLLKSSLALAELMAFSLRHSVLISGTRIHFGLIEYISSSPKLISSGIGTRLCSFLCLKQIALYSESYGFPGSHVWLWELAECQIIDAFEFWCGRRLMRVPWTARKSNQSILKKINPEYSLEGLMLRLKLQDFGHQMWRADSLEITLILGKIKNRRRKEQQRTR